MQRQQVVKEKLIKNDLAKAAAFSTPKKDKCYLNCKRVTKEIVDSN